MEVIFVQLGCLAILFTAMTVCGIIPIVLIGKNRTVHLSELTSTFISLCSCLAGGVFIGMCFLGLFPYIHEKFSEVLNSLQYSTRFPVSEFVIIIGFFIIFTLEQTIFAIQNKSHTNNDEFHLVRTNTVISKRTESDESYIRLLDSDVHDPDETICSEIPEIGVGVKGVAKRSFGNHSHCDVTFAADKESGLRHFILLLAISIHSLFEGVALGLQTDTVKILHLFIAVLIHEALVVFCLGVNIAKLDMGLFKSIKYIFVVTGSIPVGIVLGLVIGSTSSLFGAVMSAVLQGIAAGIFIHVTFMEIIPEEFSSPERHFTKIFFMFLGFMLMSFVNFFLGNHK